MEPLIITGMHRSGTSFTASLFEQAGIFLGKEKVAAGYTNPRGFFEDAEFCALQREMLRAACVDEPGGWADWGWTPSEKLNAAAWERFRGRALGMLAGREEPWGWKDPRTSLLADFWLELAPGARFVFVFREPWEVADSMARITEHPLRNDRGAALRIWSFYNGHLLDFARRHAGTCFFLPLECVRQLGAAAVRRALVAAGMELPGEACRDAGEGMEPVLFDAALLHRRGIDEEFLAGFRKGHAGVWEQWEEMNRLGAAWLELPSPPRTDVEPRLSVVVPCYNDGAFLLESLGSIAAGTPVPCETIIVDDGSTSEATRAILKKCEALGWRVMRQPHRGISAARNEAIRAARGEYILPLDADNRLAPDGMAAIRFLDADAEIGVVYGDAGFFGERMGRGRGRDFDMHELHLGNYIDACAMFRKSLWVKAGGYDHGMAAYENWDLWLTFAEDGAKFYHVAEVTFECRVRSDSVLAGMTPERHGELVEQIAAKHGYYREHHTGLAAGFSRRWREECARRGETEQKYEQARHRCEQAERELAGARQEREQFKEILARERESMRESVSAANEKAARDIAEANARAAEATGRAVEAANESTTLAGKLKQLTGTANGLLDAVDQLPQAVMHLQESMRWKLVYPGSFIKWMRRSSESRYQRLDDVVKRYEDWRKENPGPFTG